MHTTFVRTIRQGKGACLEWTSRVARRNGQEEFEYSGVTLLHVEDDQVAEMRSYFDTRPFMAWGPAQQGR